LTISQNRARAAIPNLRARLSELRALARRCTAGVEFKRDDDFAFMALFFQAKQIEHTDGVLKLESHADTELIARSMLEGLWLLKWAYKEPAARALRWRYFAWIHDWRVLRDRDAAGRATEVSVRAAIEEAVKAYGPTFYTSKAKHAVSQKQPLPDDPFVTNWAGIQIRQIAEAVGDLDLYVSAYDDFSNRHHWDPAGIAQGVQQTGDVLDYDASSPNSEAGGLAVAYQCLFGVCSIVNEYFNLNQNDKLTALLTAYLADASDVGIDPTTGDVAPMSSRRDR
jgi:hypothetical protein